MELTTLSAISPVDGRYRKQVQHLDEYFSEYALIKYRVIVEIKYFLPEAVFGNGHLGMLIYMMCQLMFGQELI